MILVESIGLGKTLGSPNIFIMLFVLTEIMQGMFTDPKFDAYILSNMQNEKQ